jgi:hypothetical protein
MGWMTKESWFSSRYGQEIFLFSIASSPAVRPTQPPVQWALRAVFLGVKRPGCEADSPLPSSAKVKKDGPIPSLPHVFKVWHLIEHRDNFTFICFINLFRRMKYK